MLLLRPYPRPTVGRGGARYNHEPTDLTVGNVYSLTKGIWCIFRRAVEIVQGAAQGLMLCASVAKPHLYV